MPSILARKLGMTQVFGEDGNVARVTVLEAGPCPVTAVRTAERDGYEAIQLAFGATKEKHLTKARLGHLRKADAPPMRALVEFRLQDGRGGPRRSSAQTVTVEAFSPGERVKIRGTSKGKGFQGTIKRHNFKSGPKSHGSHNVRAPGSIGASATPSRVLKGIRGPGQMGNKRVTQKGLEVVRVDAAENLLLVRGSVPGPRGLDRGGALRWLTPPCSAAPRRPRPSCAEEAFGERLHARPLVHQSVRAEQAARRRGTASTKNRARGLRRWRQAVAPEGHRPRPRGLEPLAPVDRRGHRLRSPAPLLHLQGQPQGAARGAAQRPLPARPARLDGDPRRAAPSARPSTARAAELLEDWEPRSPARPPHAGGADRARRATPRCRFATSPAWPC